MCTLLWVALISIGGFNVDFSKDSLKIMNFEADYNAQSIPFPTRAFCIIVPCFHARGRSPRAD